MANPISTGLVAGCFGFVLLFIGYAGWQDPEGMAVMGSWTMREADEEMRTGYGRILAGCLGVAGVVVLLLGASLILTAVVS